jgi:hypothetical protein
MTQEAGLEVLGSSVEPADFAAGPGPLIRACQRCGASYGNLPQASHWPPDRGKPQLDVDLDGPQCCRTQHEAPVNPCRCGSWIAAPPLIHTHGWPPDLAGVCLTASPPACHRRRLGSASKCNCARLARCHSRAELSPMMLVDAYLCAKGARRVRNLLFPGCLFLTCPHCRIPYSPARLLNNLDHARGSELLSFQPFLRFVLLGTTLPVSLLRQQSSTGLSTLIFLFLFLRTFPFLTYFLCSVRLTFFVRGIEQE